MKETFFEYATDDELYERGLTENQFKTQNQAGGYPMEVATGEGPSKTHDPQPVQRMEKSIAETKKLTDVVL